ncbi:MAG: CBS domain-containing protein [Kineosporiaceae bacterium]
MRAADLVERVPLVTAGTDAVTAARVLAEHRLTGLVVADDDGVPVAVLGGPDVLRLVVPEYVLTNPALAHVYDEEGSEEVVARLRERTLDDLLRSRPHAARPLPSVAPDDTLIEIASLMCEEQATIVIVRERHGGAFLGVVTLSRLAAALLTTLGEGTDAVQARLDVDVLPHDASGPVAGGSDAGTADAAP